MNYSEVIKNTADMVNDRAAQELTKRHGLNIVNVLWEDTGRYKGSCTGPNISDLTIEVSSGHNSALMPAFRFPNFSDETGDVDINNFYIWVGNENNSELKQISLREYLINIQQYLSHPTHGTIKGSLLSDRDTHVLTSAQFCFLPIPSHGNAKYNPVIFNYQSTENDPAVLTIMATVKGTSTTIIDNKRNKSRSSRGQQLFFNNNGQRCPLTGERITDFAEKMGTTVEEIKDAGLDVLIFLQVPLKTKEREEKTGGNIIYAMAAGPAYSFKGMTRGVDIEQAVLGHGEAQGTFVELDGLTIERDERFPIRATIQFYRATSNGLIDEENVVLIKQQIEKVYKDASWTGSLVTGGHTPRITEMAITQPQWWTDFWKNHPMDRSEQEIVVKLNSLFGDSWRNFSLEEINNVRLSGRLF